MPKRLEEWLWRAERIRAGRTELTRRDAEAARAGLQADRSAYPSAYAPFAAEVEEVLDTLAVLTEHRSRREDLITIVSSEQRARRRESDTAIDEPAESELSRGRRRAAAELARVPGGLPRELDAWVRRVIRHEHGIVLIDPEYASRAETVLRSDVLAYPAEYSSPMVQRRLTDVLRRLGDIATRQRPGIYTRELRRID